MSDVVEKTGQPTAWRFPFDMHHMAHTSDPAVAAKYRDAEPLFTADEPGLWRFWNAKAREQAETIDRLRQELAEARERLQDMHRRAQKAESQTLYSREQAAQKSNEARRIGWLTFYASARRAWTLRDRDDARAKALDEAVQAASHFGTGICGSYGQGRRDAAAAIRSIAEKEG